MAPNQSVAAVIQENEYWIRLTTFLHDPLKYGLLRVLHNTSADATYAGLPDDPYLLYQKFSKHTNLIAQLVKKRVLQQEQVDLLLPPNDNKTDSSNFDVTLIVVLIRNFTTLPPPLNGWNDKNPPAHDRTKGAGVIRGREWRNFVHHTEPKEIDKAKFNLKWTEGTQIIKELGYQYDATRLKIISLDPKHEIVLKSLYTLIKNLATKQDSHSQIIDNLTHQLNRISNQVQHLQRRDKEHSSNTKSSSCCLKSVLECIFKEIKEEEAKELLDQLNVNGDGDFVDILKSVPWEIIKRELKMLARADMVKYIQENTLITRGLKNASDDLRNHYKVDLINCLVEQPLSSIEMESVYAPRESVYVDLVVLPSSTVDEEWSNSDRDAAMKQSFLDKSSTENAVENIIKPHDEMIFIRGVAGVGKSTLIDMFTLKWAKNELTNNSMFDFVFKFTCRELNQILNEFGTLEQLFQLQYPNIFSYVTLDDLAEISDRVLIIVDGLDELKDIYKMDGLSSSSFKAPFLQVICDLLNPKSTKSLKHNKTIVCGRPKACEFVKNQFSKFKIKTIEVCGFSNTNVQRYIRNFFKEDQLKATTVQDIIASSYNLKVMSTVPVLLWVICNVYSEDLIKTPINTNTELYFYACLVFLRNHCKGSEHRNLLDIIQDQAMVDVVYSLMVLSVKTYMQNQVLFTDEDIKNLKCPIHLEQTGFIVKYSLSNIEKSTYQFRHLILQEFLCGMYLCVTKRISPFLSNRELSSCMPMIFGIHRITQEKGNDIFLHFYNALVDSHDRKTNFFATLLAPFRSQSLSYNKFIKKFTPLFTVPESMIKGQRLIIVDLSDECREFLDLFKEANNTGNVPVLEDAQITVYSYKDFKNVLNLLEKLHITEICELKLPLIDMFDKSGNMDEDLLRFCEMKSSTILRTVIFLKSITFSGSIQFTFHTIPYNCIQFREGLIHLHLYLPLPFHLPDIIKTKSNKFEIWIGYKNVLHHDTVPPFLQEITKYAISQRKEVLFDICQHRFTDIRYTIESILKNSGIDSDNRYIRFESH